MKNEPIKIYVGRESVCAADDVKAHLYVSSDFDDFATKLCAKLPFGKRSRYLGRLQQNAGGDPDGIIVWGKKTAARLFRAIFYWAQRNLMQTQGVLSNDKNYVLKK